MMFFQLIPFSVVVLLLGNPVQSFNLSKKPNYILRDPDRNTSDPEHKSYFGYSLVLQANSIFIGAPKAKLPDNSSIEAGGIYRCYFTEECSYYKLEYNGPQKYNPNINHQMMGFAMDGHEAQNDTIIACAPSYIARTHTARVDRNRDYQMTGLCMVVLETNEMPTATTPISIIPEVSQSEEYRVNRKTLWFLKYVQQGISVHAPSGTNGESIFLIGAPGTLQWRGNVIRYNMTEKRATKPNAKSINMADNSYLGFAISSAYFDRETWPDRMFYIASAPQSFHQKGEVLIYEYANTIGTHKIKTSYQFTGKQLGEYFGYALTADDLNGDKLPDVVISAPYHSLDKYSDNGVVYVYENLGTLSFTAPKLLSTDSKVGGRFGLALSRVGDINGDAFNDIAIGAPFENNGAVYIFHGSRNGLSTSYSQKLEPPYNDLTEPQWFGYSLSRGVDFDENGNNDIAISAPNAGVVYIHRSYPVVSVYAEITLVGKDILSEDDNEAILQICYSYRTYSNFNRTVEISLQNNHDSKLKRVKIGTPRETMYLKLVEQSCFQQDLTITPPTAANYDVSPIEIVIHHDLVLRQSEDQQEFCSDCVVIDPRESKTNTRLLLYNQGSADFNLTGTVLNFSSPLVIGSRNQLTVRYDITNSGDRAFATVLRVSCTQGSFQDVPHNCKAPVSTAIVCDIDDELKLQKKVSIEVNLNIKDLDATHNPLLIYGDIETVSQFTDTSVMKHDLEIGLAEFSALEVTGKSKENQIKMQSSWEYEEHIFTLTNKGPSRIKEAYLEILLPSKYYFSPGKVIDIFYIENITITGSYNGKIITVAPEAIRPGVVEPTYVCDSSLWSNGLCALNSIAEPPLPDARDAVYKYLPQNRTTYLNCILYPKTCISVIVPIHHFEVGEENVMTIKLGFRICPIILRKILSKMRHILVIESKMIIHKDIEIERNINSLILTQTSASYTIIYAERQSISSTSTTIYVVSAIAAIVILCCFAFFLYRKGFFVRPEREDMRKLMHNTTDLFIRLVNIDLTPATCVVDP